MTEYKKERGAVIEKPIVNHQAYSDLALWCNENNYCIIDQGNYYEVMENTQTLNDLKVNKLLRIKEMIASTDYKCLKYVDGELTEEEYVETRALRATLRTAYNAIEVARTKEQLIAIM